MFVEKSNQYIADVLAGRVVACKWVKAACVRQQQDLKRWATDGPYYFDEAEAARACRFISLLPHTKGEWASRGERIALEPWQCFIICTVFGWRRRGTKLRRFQRSYIEVARKNAKSTLSSAIALYMLAADGEAGAEIYSAATKKDQARIVWEDSQRMVRKSAALREELGVAAGAHAITVLEKGSKYIALSSDDDSLDGLNPSFACIDELHAHKNRGTHDVLITAMGARSQPLLWRITTAGFDMTGICYEVRGYVCSILTAALVAAGGMGYECKGAAFEDDQEFGIIYTADDGVDVHSETAWRMANPNYAISVKPEYLASMSIQAQRQPSKLNNYLTKHLNVWVNAATAWIDSRHWSQSAITLDREALAGRSCVVAVDLALTRDIAAVQVLFPPDEDGGDFVTFGRYFLPSAVVEASENASIQGWVADGSLVATPGNEIDHGEIAEYLDSLALEFNVRCIGFDPRMATMLKAKLAEKGIGAPVVDITQNVATFAEPMNTTETLIIAHRIKHDGNPCMAWMMANVMEEKNRDGLGRPVKPDDENKKIDGAVALIMAVYLYQHLPSAPGVYAIGY